MSDTACDKVQSQLGLYLYGELTFDEEERVETHVESCAGCAAALEKEREFHAALDKAENQTSPSLLWESRQNLRDRLELEPQPESAAVLGWWSRFVSSIRPVGGFDGAWMRPAGALALVALGFFGSRLVPSGSMLGGLTSMGITGPQTSRVRFIEPADNGRIQIVLDETRQRTITGELTDQEIRGLLMSAAKDPSDPGLRAETMSLLNADAKSADIRGVLLYALRHDQNAGVRLKALESLRPFANDSEVRTALTEVLLNDNNPGLRAQAIDLLTQDSDDIDRQVIGVLQELMNRESNAYVRQRSQRLLEAVNASAEIY
jgi:hypothetical protein